MAMNKKASCCYVAALVVLVVVLGGGAAEAATCDPTEMSPCAAAILYGAPPTGDCCGKLRQQKPCLCGYLRNPNLRQYVNSPNARRVATTCAVPYPNC